MNISFLCDITAYILVGKFVSEEGIYQIIWRHFTEGSNLFTAVGTQNIRREVAGCSYTFLFDVFV
jgi:hypothetical protein